jgi:hypothetical protein
LLLMFNHMGLPIVLFKLIFSGHHMFWKFGSFRSMGSELFGYLWVISKQELALSITFKRHVIGF